ncbi:MAG TPA: L-lysine--8-amino-7-oxononanoate transaminase, partial [Actinobacteria bacterium]|nr:L-lysine--8-amino-7-oxononanoate transaminase [Actinomycetota bacterium]
ADSPGILREGQTRAERAAEVLQQMRELLERDGQRICGIVIEPLVQAAAGMLTHDAS